MYVYIYIYILRAATLELLCFDTGTYYLYTYIFKDIILRHPLPFKQLFIHTQMTKCMAFRENRKSTFQRVRIAELYHML